MSPVQNPYQQNEAIPATGGMTPGPSRPVESRDWPIIPRAEGPRLRICIVCGEFLGPFRNGGIGTAYTRLAELLNAAGHDVTLLYTNGRFTLTQPVEYWIQHYLERGMRFVPLPDSPIHLKALSYFLEVAHRVYVWLKSHDEFDIVHFAECAGYGYYALAAQRQGLILRQATTIVGLHSPSQWIRVASERLACGEPELEDDFLERRSTELADVVWSPSQYMLDWARNRCWTLPESTHVRPLLVRQPGEAHRATKDDRPLKEIVFFGRQETRKGLFLFFEAIQLLARFLENDRRKDQVVTILGKPTVLHGQGSEQIIGERSRGWPFAVRVLPDRNEQEALNYLQGEGRLAVMPSLMENYPNTVLECLAYQVPFLASRVGGIPEQIAAEDLDRVCFEPKPHILAERLLQALRQGHAPARFAFDPDQNNAAWVRWHEQIHDQHRSHRAARAEPVRPTSASNPTVSVCVTRRGRPHHFRAALGSILDQELAPHEVIVVAVGNPADEIRRELDDIEQEFDFAGRGWRMVRQDNRDLGAACNRAAAEAKGDFLLFMDEDGIATPQAIATFTAVARHTDADVLTCLIDIFASGDDPGGHPNADHRRLFSGANPTLSLLHNTFGTSNALFRRTAFLAVEGFSDALGPEQEDWELYSRLMVRGCQIAVIPEALFCDRALPAGAVQATPAERNYLRTLRPHLESLPRPYHTLLEFTVGQSLAKRVTQCQAANAPALPTDVPAPLRYRMVDALNVRLKRIRLVHQIARSSLQGMLRTRRMLIARIQTLRSSSEARGGSRAHLGRTS